MKINSKIAIIGAGPAGIAAALAAASLGRQVVLVGDRPVLGGNSSSEIRVWTRGAVGGGNLFAEEMGVWGEVKLRNLLLNPHANPVEWDDVLLEQVLKEENIHLLLNTHVTSLEQDDCGKVTRVFGFQMGTEKHIEIEADFFMDCTGDGTLGVQAGVPYHMGKESREQYGESMAPEKDESSTFGNTIFFYTQEKKQPVAYKAPSFVYSMEKIEKLIGRGGRVVNEKMNGCDYWWFELGGSQNTIDNAQDIAFELRKLVLGVWNYIKNSGKFNADYLALSWVGNIPGKRESRRMKTKTVLTQEDVLKNRNFKDAAFYGGWYMDFHPSDGVYTTEDFCEQIPVQVYSIPLSTLYHTKVPNLLFAGRNIGTSHAAFSSTRIMNTCALSGQAGATLAHYCLDRNIYPEHLDEEDFFCIQQTLLREDMLIPGISNQDPKDLARQASVRTTAGYCSSVEDSIGKQPIEKRTFIVAPFGTEVQFLIESKQETVLKYTCYKSSLPSRLALGKELESYSLKIEAGKKWVTFPMPQEDSGFCTFLLQEQPNIALHQAQTQLTGVLGGQMKSPYYWYPCVRLKRAEILYGVENIINGLNRPWNRPNVWVSEPISQPSVELSWEAPQKISQVMLYANPDLSMELTSSHPGTWDVHHGFAERTQMPPQLLRDIDLYYKPADSQNYVLAAQVKDNWKRKIVVNLPQAIHTNQIKVVLISNYGAKTTELYEIRIYE